MFALPSVWNLIVSIIAFFVVAWYINRYLDDQGIPKGRTRGLLVFVFASLVSWGAGAVVDWAQGTPPASQGDLSQSFQPRGNSAGE